MREKLVTREKVLTRIKFKCIDVNTEEIFTEEITIMDNVSECEAMRTIIAGLDKDKKFLKIDSMEKEKKRYALDEKTYLEMAHEIEPIKRYPKKEVEVEGE